MKPRISVVVPVFNREKLVVRCLESIYGQTLQPTELIVVDNSSTDNTSLVVKEWIGNAEGSNMSCRLLHEEKKGACLARQKGLDNITGDYVIFFDSDDAMEPSLIEDISRTLESSPQTDIVCWKVKIHQLDGTEKIPTFFYRSPLESHLIHTLLRPQGYAVRKAFLENAGGWSKPIQKWNDLELGLRLLLLNPKIKTLPKVLAQIYSQEDSISGTDFSSSHGIWEKTIEEMEKDIENSNHPEKNKLKKILQYRKAVLASHYYREGNKKLASSLMKKAQEKQSYKTRLLLHFTYLYTRKGHRGAWRIAGRFM